MNEEQRLMAEIAALEIALKASGAGYAKLEEALRTIACVHVDFPELNYPNYAAMAVVTARNAIGFTPSGEVK